MKQLRKYRVQIAALGETDMYGSGIQTIGDYTMIYSGVPSDKKTRNPHGASICLDKTATKIWKESGSQWEAVNGRIVKVRLNYFPVNITVISVYASINPATMQMRDACEKFYMELQDTIN